MQNLNPGIIIHSLLTFVCGALCVIFFEKDLLFCAIIMAIFAFHLIVLSNIKSNKIYNDIGKLIDSIRFSEFTLYYNQKSRNKKINALSQELNLALEKFRTHSREAAEIQTFYETMFSVIDSGIIVFDKDEKVVWINDHAKEELYINRLEYLNELTTVDKSLPAMIKGSHPGELNVLRFYMEGEEKELALSVTDFNTRREQRKLVSLKNIHSVLEKEEMQAWQKLIRVLTHEIMNSITPIISLSETLTERTAAVEANEKDFETMRTALEVIFRRSKGLLDFVENYRKLSRLPQPNLAPVNIPALLKDISALHNNVSLKLNIPDDTIINIDRAQIEQVLINIIKNGKEACENPLNAKIAIDVNFTGGQMKDFSRADRKSVV